MRCYYKIILLIGWIFSIGLIVFYCNFISLVVSFFLLIFNFIFSKERNIMVIGTIFSVCCILVNSFIMYKNYRVSIDILKGNNVLLGNWSYNDIGGTYIFNDDNSFYQYISSNSLDNYCFGKYSYTYGGIDNEKHIIYKDSFYYYYTLTLDTKYCVINGNTDKNIKDSEFVFSVNIDNYNDIIFMDIDKNDAFKINKLKK